VTDTAPPSTWEDTNPQLVLAQLRANQRAVAADVIEHDGEIKTLQGTVAAIDVRAARIDERVGFLTRAFWMLAAGVGALLGDVVLRRLGAR
jgi:hypothetical protein